MGIHLLPFIGVAILIALTPGPDTLLVTKNALLHGRGFAFGTVAGISVGLMIWTAAAALGIAAVIRESAVAFTILKVAGGVYLAWLGFSALRSARRPLELDLPVDAAAGARPRQGFRQGLLTNLSNPKIAIFFTSLLPQFVSGHRTGVGPFLVLGAVFSVLGLTCLCCYVVAAARLSALLASPRVKATIDRLTGVVLIGVGVRLVLEHR
jgi:RhtB (resistance to homoserine/threonine) family protein